MRDRDGMGQLGIQGQWENHILDDHRFDQMIIDNFSHGHTRHRALVGDRKLADKKGRQSDCNHIRCSSCIHGVRK